MSRSQQILPTLVLVAAALVVGCSGSHDPPAVDAASPDAGPDAVALGQDARPTEDVDRAPFACGEATCGGHEICAVTYSGSAWDAGAPDAGGLPYPPPGWRACVPRPPSCATLVESCGNSSSCSEEARRCIEDVCRLSHRDSQWGQVSDGGNAVHCPAG